MAKLKRYVSGYRPPPLAFSRVMDDPFFKSQRDEYLLWLCRARGWTTSEAPCPECKGEGTILPSTDHMTYSRLQRWKRDRRKAGLPPWHTHEERETCWKCEGRKTVPCNPRSDIKRAEKHLQEQKDRLGQLAQSACDYIEERLREVGLRPVRTRCTVQISTAAEYDAMEAEHQRASDAHRAAWDAYSASKQQFDEQFKELPEEKQLEWFNGRQEAPYKALEKQADALSKDLRKYGRALSGLWHYPGKAEILHVGTRGAHKYADYPKPLHAIVIKPGRSPSHLELNALIVEALAVLAGLDPKQLGKPDLFAEEVEAVPKPKAKVIRKRYNFASLQAVGASL